MTSPNDIRLRELLSQVMSRPAGERHAFLSEACAGDAALGAEVQGLLSGLERAGEFLSDVTMGQPDRALASTVDQAPISEGPGARIGRYKLLQLIGEGGFGSVFMAEQEQPVCRRVALKIIKPGMDTKQVIARFEAERQALAMMDHTHIARVFDAGATDTGRPYFVMELVRGVPITEYCDSQNLSTRERLELFIPVCNAVQHAHQKGIIHRDIKPSNVMVTMADGKAVPKVIDFGIAKATNARLTEQTYFTEYRQFIGTPQYMSPEQAEMTGIDIDTRSDIYSLGVLLYELLTGTTPLDAKELRSQAYEEMRRMIRDGPTPRPSTKISGLGDSATTIAQHRKTEPRKLGQLLRGELDWIVMRALEKDRTRRYDTPGSLAADIQRHLDNEPVLARPPSTVYAMRKFVSKHRFGMLAGTAVLAALVVGSTLATVGLVRVQFALARVDTARIEAHQQWQLAVENARRADNSARLASEREIQARNSAAETERLFAEGLVSRGDALTLAGRWVEARQDYWEAYDRLNQLRVSPFRAEAAIACTYAASPPALYTLSARAGIFGNIGNFGAVAISPDGRRALAGDADNTLKLWDLITGREIRTLAGHTNGVTSVAFSLDGRTALSGSLDQTLKLWDLDSGKEIRTLSGQLNPVDCAAISPDGRTALSGSGQDRTVKLWDLSTGNEIRTLSGHTGGVIGVAFSPDGQTALSCSGDKTLKVWDLATGKEIRTLTGHTGSVFCVAISPDGRTALSGSEDNTLKVWNLTTGKEIRTLPGHTDGVTSVAISRDGHTAVSGGLGTLKLWDLSTGREIRTLFGHAYYVHGIALSPDGRTAISGSDDNTFRLWDLSPGKEVRTLSGHAGRVTSVAISPDGRTALSGSWDNTLKLWDLSTSKEIRTLAGQTARVASVAISPDGRSAISGSEDRTLKLWDLSTGKEIRTFAGHTRRVTSVAISPDGRTALSGSADRTLKLWDLSTGKDIRALSGHNGAVQSVAIRFDGRTAFSGSRDTLKVWDLSTGMNIRTFSGNVNSAIGVVISPDGRTALSGSSDNKLLLWDPGTGKEIRTLSGHTGMVLSAAISPDGRTAFSGSTDRMLKLWDLSTGKEIRTLSAHAGFVFSIAVSPDGRIALAGGGGNTFKVGDTTLQLWDFSRSASYKYFDQNVPIAQAALQKDPDDATALAVLGNWYAFRGLDDWAVELLERARAGGEAVNPLTLARCYWELDRNGDAKREFVKALDWSKDPAEKTYLGWCIQCIEREPGAAATAPVETRQSTPAPATPATLDGK